MPTPRGATPEQKAREKAREQAQKQKARSLKDAKQTYINIIIGLGLNPGEYKKIIEQAAKAGWGTETFLKRAKLETAAISAGEEEGFLAGILSDYEDAYGIPAEESLIGQLQNMSAEQLATYKKQLDKILEQKATQTQGKNAYLSELTGVYFKMWGKMPPPGYVEGKMGLNIYEFEEQERQKPEFELFSPIFQQEYENYAGDLLTQLGAI